MRKIFYVFKCGRKVEKNHLKKRPVKKAVFEKAFKNGATQEEIERLRKLHFCHQCGARLAFRMAKCSDCENDVMRTDSRGVVSKRCPTCEAKKNRSTKRVKAQSYRDSEKYYRSSAGQIRRGDYCKEKLSKCINCGRTKADQRGCIDCEYYHPVFPGHDPVPLARVMGLLPKLQTKRTAA